MTFVASPTLQEHFPLKEWPISWFFLDFMPLPCPTERSMQEQLAALCPTPSPGGTSGGTGRLFGHKTLSWPQSSKHKGLGSE